LFVDPLELRHTAFRRLLPFQIRCFPASGAAFCGALLSLVASHEGWGLIAAQRVIRSHGDVYRLYFDGTNWAAKNLTGGAGSSRCDRRHGRLRHCQSAACLLSG